MVRIRLSRAGPEDDADLRAFLRESPSGGGIRLAIEKEPSFFAAFEVEGDRGGVIVARDQQTGRVAAFGTRSEKPCLVNGSAQPTRVGYLSNLRVDPEYRNGTVLARGYRAMQQVHREGSTNLYLTTIMADNEAATRVLTSGRAGLPTYRDWGLYRTFVLTVRRNPWRAAGRSQRLRVRRAEAADLGRVVSFLSHEGRRRQFFPAYDEKDLLSPSGLLRGLRPGDIYLAEEDGRIRGTTAVWCQRDFRQWVVKGYEWPLGSLRWSYNAFAALSGRPRLPPAGRVLDYRFLALVCAHDDDPEVMRALWGSIWSDLKSADTESLVVVGLHDRDPLSRLLSGTPAFVLNSRLYVVHWEDGAAACDALDDSVPYVEIGSI